MNIFVSLNWRPFDGVRDDRPIIAASPLFSVFGDIALIVGEFVFSSSGDYALIDAIGIVNSLDHACSSPRQKTPLSIMDKIKIYIQQDEANKEGEVGIYLPGGQALSQVSIHSMSNISRHLKDVIVRDAGMYRPDLLDVVRSTFFTPN